MLPWYDTNLPSLDDGVYVKSNVPFFLLANFSQFPTLKYELLFISLKKMGVFTYFTQL
jgi:hypothetical protein